MIHADAYYSILAALEWQYDLGVDEAINEAPISRYDLLASVDKDILNKSTNFRAVSTQHPTQAFSVAGSDIAQKMAQQCQTMDDVINALAVFDYCTLKKGARHLVFASGNKEARVLVIKDYPSYDDDKAGYPLAGIDGVLFDEMFGAIGLLRTATQGKNAVHVAMAMPWRPPVGQVPTDNDIALIRPFLRRYIELLAPDIIIVMGNTACKAVFEKPSITPMRGKWQKAFKRPALAMLPLRILQRDPLRKRDSWQDLLLLQEKLTTV